jgi:2-dehydro-3-deoxygluconokinase
MAQVVTFGEIMLRLSPPGFQRILQAHSFDISYGGPEASVAVSLSNYGISSAFVTCLPPNEIGQAAINYLRAFGVDTSHVVRSGERVGAYYLEIGANQRRSKVVFDRDHSAISENKPGVIPWSQVFTEARWFHFTATTPAISQGAADVCLEAATSAKEMGLTVSCDLNYRVKQWKYGKTPTEVMAKLMPYVDIAFARIGIKAAEIRLAEDLSPESYSEVASTLMRRFPNLKKACISLRGNISTRHNAWSGILYDGRKLYSTTKYDITNVVDRVGSGDAFAAGLIYSLLIGKDDQEALDFATAAGALKHSILFDLNLVSLQEVNALIKEADARKSLGG